MKVKGFGTLVKLAEVMDVANSSTTVYKFRLLGTRRDHYIR